MWLITRAWMAGASITKTAQLAIDIYLLINVKGISELDLKLWFIQLKPGKHLCRFRFYYSTFYRTVQYSTVSDFFVKKT